SKIRDGFVVVMRRHEQRAEPLPSLRIGEAELAASLLNEIDPLCVLPRDKMSRVERLRQSRLRCLRVNSSMNGFLEAIAKTAGDCQTSHFRRAPKRAHPLMRLVHRTIELLCS